MAKLTGPRAKTKVDAEGKERLERGLARAFYLPPKSQAAVKKKRDKESKVGGKMPSPW